MNPNLNGILAKLKAQPTGPSSWKARCPAHDDTNASLSITDKAGRVLIHCLAGCHYKAVLQAAGIEARDLFDKSGQEAPPAGSFRYGLTLAEYAATKRFREDDLRSYGCGDGQYTTQKGRAYPGVRIPYMDQSGNVTAVRWRMRMAKEQGNEPSRFLWEKGGKISLYGLWRQPSERDSIILVEGESDCHALWSNGYHAMGFPGVDNFRPGRDEELLAGYARIYVGIEPDMGGVTLFKRFVGDPEKNTGPSSLLPKVMFYSLPGYKDPSAAWEALHATPDQFHAIIRNALRNAQPAETFKRPDAWKKLEKRAAKTASDAGDKRAITSAENGAKGGRPQTDYIGLASAFGNLFRDSEGRLTLRHWRNAWYRYAGNCWQIMPDADMENYAMGWLQDPAIAEGYHVQPSANALRNLLLGLRSVRHAGIPSETAAPAWISSGTSADGWIAMRNCVLNLEAAAYHHGGGDGAPDPADRDDYCHDLTPDLLSTFALNYDYIPGADCPRFRGWLESTLPDPDLRSTVLMLMGLALVPDTSYNVCFFLAGEGGTGKSTFLTILEALVGVGNCCRVPLLKMDDKFATWPLAESLLNIVGEMPTDDPQGRLRYIEGDFKDSISGGMISIERKGKDVCSARCTARHVFATNSLPFFFDKSEGIWDRLIIIPFEQRFRGSDGEVRDIAAQIIPDELPGILNLALGGLNALRGLTRFPEPEACRQIKQFHRERCDFDGAYLRDFYRLDPAREVPLAVAYEHYRGQLTANGLAHRSSPTFQASVIRTFGIRCAKRGLGDATRVFKGLAPNFHVETSRL